MKTTICIVSAWCVTAAVDRGSIRAVVAAQSHTLQVDKKGWVHVVWVRASFTFVLIFVFLLLLHQSSNCLWEDRLPISQMTYNVLSGTLNPTISYHTVNVNYTSARMIHHT